MSYLADVVVIGGSGGGPFEFNGTDNGATLKKILVWVTDRQVKSMKVWFTDGESKQFGSPAGTFKEFVFEDGEYFTSLSLWSRDDGQRLGAIKFKTNRSREFFISIQARLKEEVPVDVASGICMGIRGRSGLDIDSLGFMFINTILSTELRDVEYPTLHDVIPNVAVREIKSMSYQNCTSQTQEYKIETTKKITETSSWSVTAKLEFTFSLTLKAGIPLIAESEAGFELKVGVEGTYSSTTTNERMELFSFPVKVPPGKTLDVDITIGEANLDLPFKGTVNITCYNGSVLQFKTSGIYKGLTYTKAKVVVRESNRKIGEAPSAQK